MRFYYFSVFSWMAYGLYLVLVVGALSALWSKAFNLKLANPVYWILVAAITIGPWSEELWIAYNFDYLCRKDAGVFINKTVEVDGFYDDTTHWWRQLAESKYKFVESKDYIDKTLWRVERAGDEIRHFRIDKPTARYHYKRVDVHTPVAHQIKRFENVVVDSQSGEVLARYTDYSRGPYWFFISLGTASIECRETRGKSSVVYYGVLKEGRRSMWR